MVLTTCRTSNPSSYHEQGFERADKALYTAKQEGRNRCKAAKS